MFIVEKFLQLTTLKNSNLSSGAFLFSSVLADTCGFLANENEFNLAVVDADTCVVNDRVFSTSLYFFFLLNSPCDDDDVLLDDDDEDNNWLLVGLRSRLCILTKFSLLLLHDEEELKSIALTSESSRPMKSMALGSLPVFDRPAALA